LGVVGSRKVDVLDPLGVVANGKFDVWDPLNLVGSGKVAERWRPSVVARRTGGRP